MNKQLLALEAEVSQKIQKVWNEKVYIQDLQVDKNYSVWQNACDNYKRLYPGKYQNYLQNL